MIIRRKKDVSQGDAELLNVDKIYVVYGVSIGTPPQFLICEDSQLSFPFFVSADVVEVLDGKISSDWIYSPATQTSEFESSRAPLLCFKAMIDDRHFYQRLVDGEVNAVALWNQVRRKIGEEAVRSSEAETTGLS